MIWITRRDRASRQSFSGSVTTRARADEIVKAIEVSLERFHRREACH